MRTEAEIRAEESRLQRELQDLRRQKDDEARRVARERTARLEAAGAPEPFVNDDCIGMDVGDLSFYYGYESTVCPVHAKKSECDDADCEKSEWAFVLRRGKDVLAKFGTSQLNARDQFSVTENLLSAIGLCISQGILTVPEVTP